MKKRKSDILWKVIMEEVFPDLLRFIFPDADEVYNMERGFEFLDKELAELNPQPEEEKDSRFADKLVKVYHRDGAEEWVLLHVEVQGDTQDRDTFAERMYTYFYRIRDRYPGRLVSALAIFTGQDGNRMPAKYSYDYRGTKLTYEYPTVSILNYSDEQLDKSNNPFAQVIIAARLRLKEEKVSDEELLNFKLLAARKLQEKGFPMDKIRAIFNFLRNYVLFEKPETSRKFDYLFRQTDKASVMNTVEYLKAEGRQEGREEAKIESATTFVENLLKGSDFSVEKIAFLANVSIDFVNEIKSKLNGTP
jgi:predicted transposase YdaD